MSDIRPESLPEHHAPRLPQRPAAVYAAAVVTWVGAAVTAAMTLLLAVSLLWLARPVFDSFGSGAGNPARFVVEVAAVVVGLSAAAGVAAVFMLRGHRWARWLLLALSVVAALGGLMSAYYVGPLLVTAAATAVVVLLLLPESRDWFRRTGTRSLNSHKL